MGIIVTFHGKIQIIGIFEAFNCMTLVINRWNHDPNGCLFIDAGNQILFVIVFQNDDFRLAQFFHITIRQI